MPQTLFEKIWQQHCVDSLSDSADLIYIDRVFLHERTGSIALLSLEDAGHSVRHPDKVYCVMDHIVDTTPGRGDDTQVPSGKDFIQSTRDSATRAGIKLFDVNDPLQGITHVVSPELGIVQPGLTLVCPDSHTCTQGAMGALAWGIGSTEAEHAMVTNTLRVNKPATMRVRFEGELPQGVTAKDLILTLISRYGAAGGTGYVIEFAGEVVEKLTMEARMTLCNMAVEFSAFTGIIAPDQTTFDYLKDKSHAPKGAEWDKSLAYWNTLFTDPDAIFDQEIVIECSKLEPTVTWGTSPQHAVAISQQMPQLSEAADQSTANGWQKAYQYIALQPGDAIAGTPLDAAFIGSCTNSRLSDLRAAAAVLKGRKVAAGVSAICVPGSSSVKRAAEAEGIDKIFEAAGFEWRESGCSMCFFAGGETFGPQKRVISTTNRNFENRQGPGTRTHLASPVTVAASAIAGVITDPRPYLSADAP